MADLIERQAAINAVGLNTWAGSRISKLPTVDIDAITESHEKIGYDKGYRDGYAQARMDGERGEDDGHNNS